MAAFTTSALELSTLLVPGVISKAADTSVIAKLSNSTPQTMLDSQYTVFGTDPEAEFVEEGGTKSHMAIDTEPKIAGRHKAVVTLRFTNEVQYADEDTQLGFLRTCETKMGEAVGRAIDYGIFHAISPATGAVVSGWDALSTTANQQTATANALNDMDAIVDPVIAEGYEPTGIALSPAYANTLRKVRNADGVKMFPEINYNLRELGAVAGLTAGVSGTVNGKAATTPTNVLAFAGDFDMIKWGIVRDLGIRRIDAGDPDGLGDLNRTNEFALRAEILYAWAVLDPKAFTVLKSNAG